MFQIGKKETVLLDFLESLGSLEWRRYQSRIQDEWINDHLKRWIVLSIHLILAFVMKKRSLG